MMATFSFISSIESFFPLSQSLIYVSMIVHINTEHGNFSLELAHDELA